MHKSGFCDAISTSYRLYMIILTQQVSDETRMQKYLRNGHGFIQAGWWGIQ